MLYLKLFIKKHALFIFYIIYVIIIIILDHYFDINISNIGDEIVKKIISTNTNIDETIIPDISDIPDIPDIKKKEVPFYDTKNPLAASIIFFLIELACIFCK